VVQEALGVGGASLRDARHAATLIGPHLCRLQTAGRTHHSMLSDQGSHASASATQSLQTTGNYCCVFKAAPLDRELTGPRYVANKFNDAEIQTSSSRAMRG
jgi:hypothetical protein